MKDLKMQLTLSSCLAFLVGEQTIFLQKQLNTMPLTHITMSVILNILHVATSHFFLNLSLI